MQKRPLINAVIFDLDGTLLDSLRDIADAMNQGLADLGHPEHSIEAYLGFIGHGQDELVRRALPEHRRKPKNIENLSSLFRNYYERQCYASTMPFPGIIYMLQVAVSRKVKLGILSNKAHFFTKKMVSHFFRGAMLGHNSNPFRLSNGEQLGRPNKPDPTIALEMLIKLKCKPPNAALVGDMPVDMKTAKNAGMIAIGAAWGYSSKQSLADSGADMIFDSPSELARFLEVQPLY